MFALLFNGCGTAAVLTVVACSISPSSVLMYGTFGAFVKFIDDNRGIRAHWGGGLTYHNMNMFDVLLVISVTHSTCGVLCTVSWRGVRARLPQQF